MIYGSKQINPGSGSPLLFKAIFILSTVVLQRTSLANNLTEKGTATPQEKDWITDTQKFLSTEKSEMRKRAEELQSQSEVDSLESLSVFLDKKVAARSCGNSIKSEDAYFLCFQGIYNKKFTGKAISLRMYKVLYSMGLRAITYDSGNVHLNRAELGLRIADDLLAQTINEPLQKDFLYSLSESIVSDVEKSLERAEKFASKKTTSTNQEDRAPAGLSKEEMRKQLRIETYKERLIRVKSLNGDLL